LPGIEGFEGGDHARRQIGLRHLIEKRPRRRDRIALGLRLPLPRRKLPVWPDEMAGIAIRIPFQIILMLGLGLPKVAGRGDLRHDFPRPKTGCLDIGDGVVGDPLLFSGGIEDARAVAQSTIITLPIQSGWIVDLEEEFEEFAIASACVP
jgi:hypothetical protein